MEWKDTSPIPLGEVARSLGKTRLNSQEMLIAGTLRKEHLLDIIRNFILYDQVEGRQVKIICRYQQFRAVHRAIERLRTGKTRKETGDMDQSLMKTGRIWIYDTKPKFPSTRYQPTLSPTSTSSGWCWEGLK